MEPTYYFAPWAQYLIQEREARRWVAEARSKIIAEALAAGKKVTEIHDEIIIED